MQEEFLENFAAGCCINKKLQTILKQTPHTHSGY
jgi:hypothetical protein